MLIINKLVLIIWVKEKGILNGKLVVGVCVIRKLKFGMCCWVKKLLIGWNVICCLKRIFV